MFKRIIATLICVTFSFTNLQYVQAQDFSVNQLPVPGTMVGESAPFSPLALKGLVVNLQKPLEFQFIVDTGKGPQDTATIKDQANQLVKYFLAGLTIPEGDLWVNLSPYEKNRMVPVVLGQTDLGRDLLAQDYILKQLTASLIYPEKDLGKAFWSRVYAKAQAQFGTTNIPVNTFNKVWILPDQAQVFENKNAAYVTKSTLKVMLDEDYLALNKHLSSPNASVGDPEKAHSVASQIVRAIILPEITKEVNTGKNFAPLRQIYQALILAKWYKETIQNGLLDAVYTNKNKVAGVNLHDPAVKEQIYERYLKAYKKGAFNYIKEDPTPEGQIVPRKYFSGGTKFFGYEIDKTQNSRAMLSWKKLVGGALLLLTVALGPSALAQNRNNSLSREQTYKSGLNYIREFEDAHDLRIFFEGSEGILMSRQQMETIAKQIPNETERKVFRLAYLLGAYLPNYSGITAVMQQNMLNNSIPENGLARAFSNPDVIALIRDIDTWSQEDVEHYIPMIIHTITGTRSPGPIGASWSGENFDHLASVLKLAGLAQRSDRVKEAIYQGKINLPFTIAGVNEEEYYGAVPSVPQIEYKGFILNKGYEVRSRSTLDDDINKALIDAVWDIDEPNNRNAVRAGEIKLVNSLLSLGAEVNTKDIMGKTPLMYASEKGAYDIVTMLIGKGADVNSKAKNGDTALSLAQAKRDKKVVDILIAAGANQAMVHTQAQIKDAAMRKEEAPIKYGLPVVNLAISTENIKSGNVDIGRVEAWDENSLVAFFTGERDQYWSKFLEEILSYLQRYADEHGRSTTLTVREDNFELVGYMLDFFQEKKESGQYPNISLQPGRRFEAQPNAAMLIAKTRLKWVLNHNTGDELKAKLKPFLFRRIYIRNVIDYWKLEDAKVDFFVKTLKQFSDSNGEVVNDVIKQVKDYLASLMDEMESKSFYPQYNKLSDALLALGDIRSNSIYVDRGRSGEEPVPDTYDRFNDQIMRSVWYGDWSKERRDQAMLEKQKDAVMNIIAKAKIAFWAKTGNVDKIATLLNDRDENIHKAALKALVSLGDKRVTPLLLEELKRINDKYDPNISAIVDGLVNVGYNLVLLLSSNNSWVRSYSEYILGKQRIKEAVDPMLTILNSPEFYKSQTRSEHGKTIVLAEIRTIVDALGEIGDTRAVESVIKYLNYVIALDDKYYASEAAKTLGNLNDQRAVDPLFEILREIPFNPRGEIFKAFKKLATREKLVRLLIIILNKAEEGLKYSEYNQISDELHKAGSLEGQYIWVDRGTPEQGYYEDNSYFNGSISAMGGPDWVVDVPAQPDWRKEPRPDAAMLGLINFLRLRKLIKQYGQENEDVLGKILSRKPAGIVGNLLPFVEEAIKYTRERTSEAPYGYDFKVIFKPGHGTYSTGEDYFYEPEEDELYIERGDPLPPSGDMSHSEQDKAALAKAANALENGGIDLNQINVLWGGRKVSVQFDPAQLIELEQSDFKGFTPVITGFQYISSPFPLLGINRPAKDPEMLAKA